MGPAHSSDRRRDGHADGPRPRADDAWTATSVGRFGSVDDSAAVGVPDERKGDQLWAYVVAVSGTLLAEELRDAVSAHLGKSFRPVAVRFVDSLPETHSAKIVRHAVRAAATGADPGDLSSIEDPAALTAIWEAC